MNLIEKNVNDLISTFDGRQIDALNAMQKRWSSGGPNEFVFPIVDGPPGTGKTTIGTAAVAQYLLNNERGKVLYMCYTNFATDRAQEKLYELGFGPDKVRRLTSNPNDTTPDGSVIGLKWDFSNISDQYELNLRSCPILLCTLHRAKTISRLRGTKTRVLVDEFSQVNAPLFFSTLFRIKDTNPDGYALLGDPKQLPVITTQTTLSPNIHAFITDIKAYTAKTYTAHELQLQYRMHDGICLAVNSLRTALRTYPIKTAKHVEDRDLTKLGYEWNKAGAPDDIRDILDPQYPFVIVDTDGLGGAEEQSSSGSTKNVEEAKLAVRLADAFYKNFQKKTGEKLMPMILSPYSAQVAEISHNLPSYLAKRGITIFRSQGREYSCVVVSFVRNNPANFIGFLREPELRAQTYVACSRAKAKLVVLLSHKTFLGAGHMDFDYLYATPSAHLVKI